MGSFRQVAFKRRLQEVDQGHQIRQKDKVPTAKNWSNSPGPESLVHWWCICRARRHEEPHGRLYDLREGHARWIIENTTNQHNQFNGGRGGGSARQYASHPMDHLFPRSAGISPGLVGAASRQYERKIVRNEWQRIQQQTDSPHEYQVFFHRRRAMP